MPRAICLIPAVAAVIAATVCPSPLLAKSEEEIGREIHRDMQKRYRVYEDRRVTRLGREVARAAGISNVRFFAVDTGRKDQPNAFQVPNHIYATRTLLEKFDDTSLTFILAHEMGHQSGRHLMKQMKKNQSIGIGAVVLGAILGVRSNTVGDYAIQVLGSAMANQYSQEQEEQADLFGLQVLHDLDIPFERAAESFRKLGGTRGESRSLNEVFGSHPVIKDRIARANAAGDWLSMRPTDVFAGTNAAVAVAWPGGGDKPLPDALRRLREDTSRAMQDRGYQRVEVDQKVRVWTKLARLEMLEVADAQSVAEALKAKSIVAVSAYDSGKRALQGVYLEPDAARREELKLSPRSASDLAASIISQGEGARRGR